MQNVLQSGKKSDDFFNWFEAAAQNNVAAAKLLDELCRNYVDPQGMAERIHDLEHRGDDISHGIYEQLNKVFMPPMDREDIITLTRALDDIMDFIHAAADAMYVYNMPDPYPDRPGAGAHYHRLHRGGRAPHPGAAQAPHDEPVAAGRDRAEPVGK